MMFISDQQPDEETTQPNRHLDLPLQMQKKRLSGGGSSSSDGTVEQDYNSEKDERLSAEADLLDDVDEC